MLYALLKLVAFWVVLYISTFEVICNSPPARRCHHSAELLIPIGFYLVFYLLLALIAFHVVFFQPIVVVNCILDRVSSLVGVSRNLVGVSCNLANCITVQ